MYMYVYIQMYVCMYVYIYIYMLLSISEPFWKHLCLKSFRQTNSCTCTGHVFRQAATVAQHRLVGDTHAYVHAHVHAWPQKTI